MFASESKYMAGGSGLKSPSPVQEVMRSNLGWAVSCPISNSDGYNTHEYLVGTLNAENIFEYARRTIEQLASYFGAQMLFSSSSFLFF